MALEKIWMVEKMIKGMLVKHLEHPEWGRGVVQSISESAWHIYFENLQHTEMFSIDDPSIKYINSIESTNRSFLSSKRNISHTRTYTQLQERNLEIPDLVSLSIDNIFSYKTIEKRLRTDKEMNCPGIYAWFFKESLLGIPDKSCISIEDGFIFKDKWKLRYIGKATGQSLKERVWDKHFNGFASVSTLRDALGSLLSEKLNLHYVQLSNSHKLDNEEKLTDWMKKYARVFYFATNNSSEIENALINIHSRDLYLNLKDKDDRSEIFQPLIHLKKNLKAALSNKASAKKAIKRYRKAATNWLKRQTDF